MKRRAPDQGTTRPAKRSKPSTSKKDDDPLNFKPQYRRSALQYIQRNGALDDPPGHLEGSILRSWPATEKGQSFTVQFTPLGKRDEATVRMEVVFTGPGMEELDAAGMKVNAKVSISLKKSTFRAGRTKMDRPGNQLLFLSGFHIKLNDKELNTFKAKTTVAPAAPLMQEKRPNEVKLSKREQRRLYEGQKLRPSSGNGEPSSGQATKRLRGEPPPYPILIKEEPATQQLPPPLPSPRRDFAVEVAPNNAPEARADEAVKPPPAATTSPQEHATDPTTAAKPAFSPVQETVPVDQLKDSFVKCLQACNYLSLSSVSTKTSGTFMNLIGVVVTFSEPRRSARGNQDWMQLVQLVDQTIVEEGNLLRLSGVKINLFAKFEEWLPKPQRGDILVLQKIKSSANGPAVGYPNSYTWTRFTGQSFDNKLQHVRPTAGSAIDPQKQLFSPPFYTPNPATLQAEVKLASELKEWWSRFDALQAAEVEKSRVSMPDMSVSYGSSRVHRLIKDATPDMAPSGYFNCTVEVLAGHDNSTDRHSIWNLYVTDYTYNDTLATVDRQDIPKALSDKVLKIEMWDAAFSMGRDLQRGCYCSLKNVRMVRSRGGYVEAKLQESKIHILDAEDDHFELKELLKRKSEILATEQIVETHYEDEVIKDAIPDRFFNFVVEVLKVDAPEDNTVAYIYVTDYTERDDLPLIDEPWARRYRHKVAKIRLLMSQARLAQTLKAKSFCLLKKLRWRKPGAPLVMGGNEQLIHVLNPKNSTLSGLEDLLERRAEFYGQAAPARKDREVKRPQSSTLKYIVSDGVSLPDKFVVRARVVEMQPHMLQGAAKQWCPRCKEEKKDLELKCLICFEREEVSDDLICISKVVLTVEDEDKSRAFVTVPLESKIFDGIQVSEIFDRPAVRRQFESRLQALRPPSSPDSDAEEDQDQEPGGPLLAMAVVAWKDDEDPQVGFALVDYKAVDG